MQAFLSNLANRQTDKQTRAKRVPPPLSEVIMPLKWWDRKHVNRRRTLACDQAPHLQIQPSTVLSYYGM